ncbi:MAG: DUF58 domain-containing protein [Gammaproteobacteria bacterium]
MPNARLTTTLRNPVAAFFRQRTARAVGGEWVELDRRRVFVLPTRAGFGFAALLLVMLVGAINYSNNLIFALTFLLAGLGPVSLLHTYRNLSRLQLQAGQGRPDFVGGALGFQVWLRAGDGRPRRALHLEVEGGDSGFAQPGTAPVAVWLHRPATRRGPQRLGRVIVSTRYPLGLFQAWSNVEFAHTELVYPAPAPPGPPPPEAADLPAQAGDHRPGDEDFHGLRHYHPGDSLRQIHWKALARGQGLLTKEFAAAGTPQLCWLDFAAAPGPDPEARLRRLCRWILDAERAEIRYGLRLPGQAWAPAHGHAHRDRCLAALACFGAPA